MHERSSINKTLRDVNVLGDPAPKPAEEFIETQKNMHAVALGSLGGRKGGLARAAKLTPEQRKEIAKKAARARWSKRGE